MAINNIETGYKPEFGLGAVYQGFNAANTEQANELEMIKQFLANQREQTMLPLDERIKSMEAARADRAATPEMLDAYSKGYIGQSQSQEAAGRKAMETAQSDINLTNAFNKNKLTSEQFLEKLNELKKSGVIGFNMQPTAQEKTSGFNWQIPADVQQQRGQGRLDILKQEKQLYPNDPNLDLELKLAQLNGEGKPSQPQATNANNSQLVQQPPIRNGGITQGSPEYEKLMQALVDTPELRQKLLLGDQKLDSAEFQKMLSLLAAQNRSSGSVGKDPYLEFNKLSTDKKLGIIKRELEAGNNPVTRQPLQNELERNSWVQQYNQDLAAFNSRNSANAKEGSIPLDVLTGGEVPTRQAPSAGTPMSTTQGKDLKAQVEQAGSVYEPEKYDYRIIDGKVQRKLKGK